MCDYCEKRKDFTIIPTLFLHSERSFDKFVAFIHNSEEDEVQCLMIGNYAGFRYIDIYYCPMCGKKLGE